MIHLNRDMEELKKEILILGSMVEDATNKAIVALVNRRFELSQEVIDGDDEIDKRELKVEDLCLKMLALHQPVAGDLRFIITILKVNNYLERMGDMATNIAERAAYLSTHQPMHISEDFLRMAEVTRLMQRECLDALVNRDSELAERVRKRDDEVDELNRKIFAALMDGMIEDGTLIKRSMNFISVCYQLERIADLADNIAEDVVFMVTGDVIRHHHNFTQLPPRGN